MRNGVGVWAILIACVFCVPGAARAQTVSVDNEPWTFMRRAYNAAEHQKRADWPAFDQPGGATGTQIHVDADLDNGDLFLVTNKQTPLPRLLSVAQDLARHLGLPQTDYITRAARDTNGVDMEFNDALQKHRSGLLRETVWTLDIGKVAAFLDKSDLPRPIVVYINDRNGAGAESIELTQNGVGTRLGGETFYGLSDISPGATLRFTSRIPWYSVIFLAFFAGALLLVPVTLISAARAQRRKGANSDPPAPEPTLADAQKKYDKQGLWVLPFFALLMLGMGAMTITGVFRKGMGGAFRIAEGIGVPMWGMPVFLMACCALMVANIVYDSVQTRRRAKITDAPTPEAAEQPDILNAIIAAVPFVVTMASAVSVLRPLRQSVVVDTFLHAQNRDVRFGITFGFIMLLFACGGVASSLLYRYLNRHRTRVLAPGDRWHDETLRLAAQSSVKIKKIVVVTRGDVNGFMTLGGTLGLTSALLRKMDDHEIRAIIAHEIGHKKERHLHWLMPLYFWSRSCCSGDGYRSANGWSRNTSWDATARCSSALRFS